jgi:hypothetical protein
MGCAFEKLAKYIEEFRELPKLFRASAAFTQRRVFAKRPSGQLIDRSHPRVRIGESASLHRCLSTTYDKHK